MLPILGKSSAKKSGFLLDIFPKKEEGVPPNFKSFEVILCDFFFLTQNLPQSYPKQGGEGLDHFWKVSKRKLLFLVDGFP